MQYPEADESKRCPVCLLRKCICEEQEQVRQSDGLKWKSLMTNLPDDPELRQLRERTGDVEAIILYMGRLRNRADGIEG